MNKLPAAALLTAILALLYFGVQIAIEHDAPEEEVTVEAVLVCIHKGSGLKLCSDVLTGCQYFMTANGLDPRLGTSGRPYCPVKNLRRKE